MHQHHHHHQDYHCTHSLTLPINWKLFGMHQKSCRNWLPSFFYNCQPSEMMTLSNVRCCRWYSGRLSVCLFLHPFSRSAFHLLIANRFLPGDLFLCLFPSLRLKWQPVAKHTHTWRLSLSRFEILDFTPSYIRTCECVFPIPWSCPMIDSSNYLLQNNFLHARFLFLFLFTHTRTHTACCLLQRPFPTNVVGEKIFFLRSTSGKLLETSSKLEIVARVCPTFRPPV